MNEEEKEAVKYFYNLRATIDESNMLFAEDINVKCGKEMIKQITIVLNLLENKDKESHFIQSELDIANAKIIKLNKMIDLMAEWIEKHTKYYDEDGCYCEVEKDICNKNIECDNCIKQYFEYKV